MLWLSALPLTALALYAPASHLTGLQILGEGWLGPLVLNFAWFANIFFLVATKKLGLGESSATISAAASFILALDTFQFERVPTDEGGSSVAVYGYGWGAILWLASMVIIVLAAGAREVELSAANKPSSPVWGEFLRMIAILAFVTLLGLTSFFAITDRTHPNQVEHARLASVAFKRGPACPLEGPVPSAILPLDGPLEVMNQGLVHPFDNAPRLLDWGIPVIRMNTMDYFFVAVDDQRILAAKAARNPSAARLVTESAWQRGTRGLRYRTTLASADGRVLFDQIWEPDPSGERHCPEYSTSPDLNQQPRKAVMAALDIRDPNAWPRSHEKRTDQQILRPVILDAKVIGRLPTPSETAYIPNAGCPANTGFREEAHRASFPEASYSHPFAIGEVFYFPDHPDFSRAGCSGEYGYLYKRIESNDDSYFLMLQKRSLKDFHVVWSRSIKIPKRNLVFEERSTWVRSLREENGMLTIDVVDRGHEGIRIVVSTPLG